ncbi:Ig-like domain-containing protein, partial [Aeromonas sp. S12(2024)]|uniref:Ig-like domain-containing protein n=1 Tax=Aeromonas sp. S12(2024) TaxID=3242885 RepID=UPI00352897F7
TVTLVVTDANGNPQTLTATVQPGGGYSVDVTTPLAEGSYQVTASVTDSAGNTGTATDDGSVDITANITVSLDDVNSGNVANAPISGTSDVGPDRTVTLVIIDANGNTVETTATTGADGSYTTNADLRSLADGNLVVTASVTDAAGNTANASDDTTLLDTEAEATIELNVIAGDDILNAEEAKGDVAVTGTVGGDAKEGDTVTLTIGVNTYTGKVQADNTFSINVPGSVLAANSNVQASVTATDDNGNSVTAETDRDYSVDTEAEATIELNVIAGDDILNAEEAKGDVAVTGTVGG